MPTATTFAATGGTSRVVTRTDVPATFVTTDTSPVERLKPSHRPSR